MSKKIALRRIDLAKTQNVEGKMEEFVQKGLQKNFELISTYVFLNQLVLVFKRP